MGLLEIGVGLLLSITCSLLTLEIVVLQDIEIVLSGNYHKACMGVIRDCATFRNFHEIMTAKCKNTIVCIKLMSK